MTRRSSGGRRDSKHVGRDGGGVDLQTHGQVKMTAPRVQKEMPMHRKIEQVRIQHLPRFEDFGELVLHRQSVPQTCENLDAGLLSSSHKLPRYVDREALGPSRKLPVVDGVTPPSHSRATR